MKKIVASTALAAMITPPLAVSADTTVVTAHEEPAIVEQAPEECCTPDLGGFYAALGIGGSFLKCEIKDKNTGNNVFSKNTNRFIGTVGLGYGKVFKDKFYIGLEALLDFTKNKKWGMDNGDGTTTHLESKGLFPSVGLRLGYVVPKYNTMVYLKVSGSYSQMEGWSDDDPEKEKVSKIAPSLALGVEKAFGKRFTARLEGDYRFKSKKTEENAELKAHEGFTVRALVSYNVRF